MTALTHIMRADARLAFAHDGTRKKLCHCCRDMLHGEDFRPEYYPQTAVACEDRYGGPCCTACMDQHVLCGQTRNAITLDEAEFDNERPYARGILPLAPEDGFYGYKIGG